MIYLSLKPKAMMILMIVTFLACFIHQTGTAQIIYNISQERYEKIVFGCYTTDLDDFENFAIKSKSLRATHINITAEDLPKSF